MKAVSLFSGAGGLDMGLERAGVETVLQAEQDPWALEVLTRHWPGVKKVTDVRDVSEECARALFRRWRDVGAGRRGEHADGVRHWRCTYDAVDLIHGGFPCQDVSVAGKRAGLSGERSGLWHEFERILRELRPRWALIENVPGLLSSNDGRDFATVLLGLERLGYGWAYRVLDARWFGVPQRRRRVFVVGCLGDAGRAAQVLAVCESCGGHPAKGQEARERVAATLSCGSHSPGVNLPGRRHEDDDNLVVAGTIGGSHHGVEAQAAWTDRLVIGSTVSEGAERPLTARASGYRMDAESENFVLADTVRSHPRPGSNSVGNLTVASAQRASDGHHGHSSPRGDGADNLIAATLNPGHEAKHSYPGDGGTLNLITKPDGVRRLLPIECERLMGWPDDWTRWTSDGRELPDSHRYRLCGNGVVSTVAEYIGHRLVAVDGFVRQTTEAAA